MLKYRPDIDGLRGVAVLAVVFFHAFPTYFPSGFIGVDIFFVISGYLITLIILTNSRDRSFTYQNFYINRITRIFPALFINFFFVLIFSWFFFLSFEFKSIGKHLLAGSLFISNFSLLSESGYFDTLSDAKPLLHLWSLAIEEQYYLIFPMIFAGLVKYKKSLLAVISIVFLYSFISNVVEVKEEPAKIFYQPQTRIWELLIGSFLVMFEFYGRKQLQSITKSVLSVVGPIFMIIGFYKINKEVSFPGWWGLLPCLGVAFCIAAGPETFINKKFLSNRLIVLVGVISYPLYLWHWPLLSFSHILTNGTASFSSRGVLILLSVLLAFLTYWLLERPIKMLPLIFKKKYVLGLLAGQVIFGAIGAAVYKGWIQPKATRSSIDSIYDAIIDKDYLGFMIRRTAGDVTYYEFGNNRKVLFYGDSHIEQHAPRVEEVIKLYPDAKGVIFAIHRACVPISNFVKIYPDPQCDKVRAFAEEKAFSDEIEVVVLGATWLRYFKSEQYSFEGEIVKSGSLSYHRSLKKLKEFMERLKAAKKTVYLILNVPEGDEFDPAHMIKRSFSLDPFTVIKKPFIKSVFLSNNGQVLNDLRKIGEELGISVIDPIPYICNAEICSTTTPEGIPIYRDSYHLRPFFARKHMTFIDDILRGKP